MGIRDDSDTRTDLDGAFSRALHAIQRGGAGELAAAGFGMQVEAWDKIGYIMTTEDIDLMVLVIRILMGVQGVALLAYFAGDQVVDMFADEDGDGIPNAFDRDYKGKNKKQPMRPVYQQNAPAPQQQAQPQAQHTLAELSDKSGMTAGQMRAKFVDYDQFAAFASGQFDYISGKNMRRLFNEVNPTKPSSK
jgi:hypothetical protein